MRGRGAALLLLMTVSTGAAGGGLCTASETPYFSCQIASKKWIGVCGAGTDAVQYRFGRPGRIELAFPANPVDAPNTMYLTNYARHQVDRVELTFTNEGVDYAVFDYVENGKRNAGVRVTPAPGKEVQIACAGRVAGELAELRGALRCDPDNALSLGQCR